MRTWRLPFTGIFVGVFAVIYGFWNQSHHGTVYALGQPRRNCKSRERRKSVKGNTLWSLGVAYPVYPFEFRFWAFEFDRLCIIWTIKGSELDSYPTLFIGDVANCILNLGQTFLSYFISLDSRISVHVTSWVPHLWL